MMRFKHQYVSTCTCRSTLQILKIGEFTRNCHLHVITVDRVGTIYMYILLRFSDPFQSQESDEEFYADFFEEGEEGDKGEEGEEGDKGEGKEDTSPASPASIIVW